MEIQINENHSYREAAVLERSEERKRLVVPRNKKDESRTKLGFRLWAPCKFTR